MARDTKMAVNMEARIPSERVTAKPRIGPVPNWYRMAAVMSVVRFESRMDTLARLKITEIVVTDMDMHIHATYLTEDLLALRSAFALGDAELLCLSGETEPVTVVSVDGVRRQITE